jgi:hypothetical protein
MCCCSDDCIQRFLQALLHMQLQPDVFLLNNVIVTVYKSQMRHVKYTAIMLKFKCVIMRVVVNFDSNGKCPCSDKAFIVLLITYWYFFNKKYCLQILKLVFFLPIIWTSNWKCVQCCHATWTVLLSLFISICARATCD